MPGAILPQIDYLDYNDVLKSENAGYERGKDALSRNTMATAGQSLAKGDYKGAKNAFFQGGDVAGGLQIQDQINKMDDRSREAAKRVSGIIGNIALAADTPEKWAAGIQGLQARGINVSKYADFGARDAALAEAGMTQAYLERADALRKENTPTYQATDVGAFNPKDGTIKPYPEGLTTKRTDLERRAIAGGLKPGTPEYQDYVLDGPERNAANRPTELERRAQAGGLTPGTPEYQAYVLGGPPKAATEKWNSEQSKAANFGNMMVQAERKLATMGPKDSVGKQKLDANGNPLPAGNPKGTLGAIRESLYLPEGLINQMRPEQFQVYKQNAEQWIRAKLRKESGAAIGKDEMAHEFTTYFPQYGDSPKLIAQKAESRAQAQRGMIAESAGAYKHFFGENEEADDAAPAPTAKPKALPPGGFPATKKPARTPDPTAQAVGKAAKAATQDKSELGHLSDEDLFAIARGQ